MRLDDYLSTVGIIKRRTIAKDLASRSMIEVNGSRAKPAYQIKLNDIIVIKGVNHGYGRRAGRCGRERVACDRVLTLRTIGR